MKNKNIDIANLSKEEYEKWFLNRLRKQRKEMTGNGALFEAFLGSGTPEFISFSENLLLRSANLAREVVKSIEDHEKTPGEKSKFESMVQDLRSKLNSKATVKEPVDVPVDIKK